MGAGATIRDCANICTMTTRTLALGSLLSLALASCAASPDAHLRPTSTRHAARQDSDQAAGGTSLAEQARDPTAPVTAVQIRYDYVASFHGLPDADQGSIVLQPIIPFKWGEQRHIARITLPYVVNAPDWGSLSDDSGAGIPPNFVPTADQSGLGDMALVDLLIYDAPWDGRWGFGAAAVLPTASDPALGAEKLSVGPAVVAMAKAGALQYGGLGQWLFSVAGDSDRDDVNVLALQPFASYGLSDGWAVGTSELVYNYNFDVGSWTNVPLGARVEKLVSWAGLPSRVYVDVEYNFWDGDVVPAWTFRLAYVPLF